MNSPDYDRALLLLLERGIIALEAIAKGVGDVLETAQGNFDEHTAESDPDYLAALAAEVEGRIQSGSTPNVAREVSVDESEDVVSEGSRQQPTIDLLEQPRDTLDSISDRADPQDEIIRRAKASNNPVHIAALEIVYSNIDPSLWGSDIAATQVETLIKMHNP